MTPAPTRRILVELCIASVDDALAAASAGGAAHRLELNSAFPLGGLTPSLGTLIEVKRATGLPVIAMLRPRPGGFCYTPADFAVMCRDLDLLLGHGADGVAFGVLTDRGEVDIARCRELVRRCAGRPSVFHRAFDFTPDPLTALEQLADLGVRRVLTSGQRRTALDGAGLIARTGCTQVHTSLRGRRPDPSASHNPNVSLNAPAGTVTEDSYDTLDSTALREFAAALDRAGKG